MLLASPGLAADPADVVAKDVVLVLDHSGSMEGEKFTQAMDAARFVLDHLNEGDRFNLIVFSTTVDAYAERPRPWSEAGEAKRWLDRFAAEGSTDIDRALRTAFERADVERPTYVLFLTDGLPTEGIIETTAILERAADAAPENVSLFAFGVGFDVDTTLLDSLAQDHHGTTTYVVPGEEVDEAVTGLYAKVSAPVLTRLEIDLGDAGAYDLYPAPLPDLFSGSPVGAGRALSAAGQLHHHPHRRGERRGAPLQLRGAALHRVGRARLAPPAVGHPQDRPPAQGGAPRRPQRRTDRPDRAPVHPLRHRHPVHLVPGDRGLPPSARRASGRSSTTLPSTPPPPSPPPPGRRR